MADETIEITETRSASSPKPNSRPGRTINPRINWIDCIRGLSIILVIVFHTYGITSEDARASIRGIEVATDTFAQFRMPAMLFLSGMFVPHSLLKGGRSFVAGKLRTIAYPYFVWSAIMLVVIGMAALTVGRRFEPAMVWDVFYRPIEHLWFLAYLFIYFMLAYALRALYPAIPAVAYYAASWIPIGGHWGEFWYLGAVFMLGVVAARHSNHWESLTKPVLASVAMFMIPLVFFFLLAMHGGVVPRDHRLALLSIVAIVGASGLAMRFGVGRATQPLRYIGRHSVVFYLVHWPAAMLFSQVGLLFGLPIVALFSMVTVAAFLASWSTSVLFIHSKMVRALFVFPRGSGGH